MNPARRESNSSYPFEKRLFGVSFSAIFIMAVPFLLGPVDASAQWTQLKNSGLSGAVFSIASDGKQMFAGTPHGVYQTVINSGVWSQYNAGLNLVFEEQQINCFLIDSTKIFLGSLTGLYVSSINQANWTQVGTQSGLPVTSVSGITKVGNNYFLTTEGKGVFVSKDHGQTWAAANTGFPSTSFFAVYSFLAVGNTLYAGTQNFGIYQSQDNGNSWTAISNGLTLANNTIHSLVANGTTIFAGTDQGVFTSSNQGALWTSASTGLPANSIVYSLLVAGTKMFAGTFDSGVYMSLDQGATWSHSGLSNNFVLAQVNNVFYAGAGDGIYNSTDGITWSRYGHQLTNIEVNSMIVKGDTLFAGGDGGVFLFSNDSTCTSLNRTQNYDLAYSANHLYYSASTTLNDITFSGGTFSDNFVANGSYYSLLFHGDTLLIGSGNRIYTSVNYSLGAAWIETDGGMPTGWVVSSFAKSAAGIFVGTNIGLFQSKDHGVSWQAVGLPQNTQVLSLYATGNRLFAGAYYGFYMSEDNGQTWTSIASGLGLTSTGDLWVKAITSSNGLFFAGTNFGVFASRDGKSWTSVSNTPPLKVFSLAVWHNHLLAGTNDWVYSIPIAYFFAPVATSSTSISQSSFTASWKSVPGASSYQFDLSMDNFKSFVSGYNNYSVADTSLAISGLTGGTNYQIRVRAIVGSITSTNSNVIATVTIPLAPVAINATGNTSVSFKANWHSSKGASSYLLDVSTDNFNTFLQGYQSLAVTDTFNTVSSLLAGASYQFRVRAANSSGTSTYSNVISSIVTGDIDIISPPFLFPNPAQKNITISGMDQPVGQCLIVDLLGKSLPFTMEQQGGTCSIDVSGLAQGLYVVTLNTTAKIYQFKFVKY